MPPSAWRAQSHPPVARALRHHDQRSAVLFPGPPALCIDFWLSLGPSLASFRGSRPFCHCLRHARIISITQMAMDDNSGFTFSFAYGGSLEIHPHSFQLIISLWHRRQIKTKISRFDGCGVNLLAFFRCWAMASQLHSPYLWSMRMG